MIKLQIRKLAVYIMFQKSLIHLFQYRHESNMSHKNCPNLTSNHKSHTVREGLNKSIDTLVIPYCIKNLLVACNMKWSTSDLVQCAYITFEMVSFSGMPTTCPITPSPCGRPTQPLWPHVSTFCMEEHKGKDQGPFNPFGLTLIPALIRYHINYKMWHEIIYSLPKLQRMHRLSVGKDEYFHHILYITFPCWNSQNK